MKKFNIPIEINSASGSQTFQVKADSKEEAIKLFNQGEGKIVESDVGVDSLEELDPSMIYEVKDKEK